MSQKKRRTGKLGQDETSPPQLSPADLVLSMARLLNMSEEVILRALKLVEQTPGPPDILNQIRKDLGLQVEKKFIIRGPEGVQEAWMKVLPDQEEMSLQEILDPLGSSYDGLQ